ncbi:hypothetical protein A2331_06735 [Candidatus Falkowbacteria bacterium RIFOXYB2_FULL_34_18]|uniref:Uncharacterized protein n=1 Tax=Candidatus Falkowbacteria bacterium RIFOXYD2_FULL_34_120 TaxID=1798007 RepID=A0A1F5TRR4_9BACT|nr:MAG: hypothetical protein A2331_06735 [Candidatus Falkowbacteria bacterium RIFOXYB2_FULL_34_18]OGF29983.1 MAG: hypothetical protein A2500_03945 [Candidatus Falkowbacteria bacterium RIFOXYC12_FULL_34_55]OGF37160.1 MAG: hypothetical protein A2466_02575 [Candidatus Falkowbacteria bacterium RIFOXYC2_FULL_34_220]OGF39519.1 MAG: hypothetical protein A2515_04310 [Candidatus Falkowbacteria bacterium RIFOXYD12_FULL_34_57]OGF41498.1 MAG: hypothetical protein A2531_02290 [Candidatus Falkowbacteria bact
MKKKNEIKHQLYNPSWIVKLAEKQLPEKQEFIQAWFGCSPKFFNFNFDNPYKGIKNIEQIPEKSDIIKILKKCTKVYAYCECGCGDPYFVVSGLKELKEKNFHIILKREDGVSVILDFLKVGKKMIYVEIGKWGEKK